MQKFRQTDILEVDELTEQDLNFRRARKKQNKYQYEYINSERRNFENEHTKWWVQFGLAKLKNIYSSLDNTRRLMNQYSKMLNDPIYYRSRVKSHFKHKFQK